MLLDPFLKAQPASYVNDISSCDAFFWIYIRQGRLGLRTESRKEILARGDLLVLPVGARARLWTEKKSGYRGVSFTVLPSSPIPWAGHEAQVIRGGQVISQLAELLAESLELNRTRAFCRPLAESLLEETKRLLTRRGEKNAGAWQDALPAAIERLLQQCVYSRERLQDLLPRQGLSARQAERVFKEAYGISPKAHLMKLRCEQAQTWLKEQNMNVTTVSRELGFSTPFQFSAWFKKQTGKSPQAWRGAHVKDGANEK